MIEFRLIMTIAKIIDCSFLVDFVKEYPVRSPAKSGELINKNNQVCGYQLTLSEHDFSNVKTYLLEEYIQAEDDPKNVTGVTDLQLEITLDYIKVSVID